MSESTRGLSRIPFTRADEEKLKSLTTWMTIYGIFMAVGAAYALFLFVVGAIHGPIHWPILFESIVGGLGAIQEQVPSFP
jgi:uncharacterized membrane protein